MLFFQLHLFEITWHWDDYSLESPPPSYTHRIDIVVLQFPCFIHIMETEEDVESMYTGLQVDTDLDP